MYFETLILIMSSSMVLPNSMTYIPNPTCSYIYTIYNNEKVAVKNPGWPYVYKEDQLCRWIVNCPNEKICHLHCFDVALPQSYDCSGDKLLVSKTGSLQLSDATIHCGRQAINVLSVSQRLTIGLNSTRKSRGGRFRCTVQGKKPMQQDKQNITKV